MTPAKLQELAREAGLTIDGDSVRSPHLDCVALADLSRFAELVQAETLLSADFYKLVRAGVLEEAAQVCLKQGNSKTNNACPSAVNGWWPDQILFRAAEALRALAQRPDASPPP